MEPVEIFITDPTSNLSVKPANYRQNLQHLDQTLPRQTGKTAVYSKECIMLINAN